MKKLTDSILKNFNAKCNLFQRRSNYILKVDGGYKFTLFLGLTVAQSDTKMYIVASSVQRWSSRSAVVNR